MIIFILNCALSASLPDVICSSGSGHNWHASSSRKWQPILPRFAHPNVEPEPEIEMAVDYHGYTDVSFWHEGKIFFVDSLNRKLCAYRTARRKLSCVHLGHIPVSFAVLVKEFTDLFVVGGGKEILLVQWNSDETDLDPECRTIMIVDENIPGNVLNYGTVDPFGRLVFGTINTNGQKWANVTFVTPTMNFITLIPRVTSSSGFVWDTYESRRQFFFIDAGNDYNVIRYNYRSNTGVLGISHLAFDWPKEHRPGSPRRLTVDDEGKLWIPLYEGHGVIRVDPLRNRIMRFIGIPSPRVSACTFGGPELDILYVSTMGYDDANQHGQHRRTDKSGSIFSVKGLRVKGLPVVEYKLKISNLLRDGFQPYRIGYH